MCARHYAFFNAETGVYVREERVWAPAPPAWWLRLPRWLCALLVDAYAQVLSQPRDDEIGLDVTPLERRDGDLRYCRFSVVDRALVYPDGEARAYLEVEAATGRIVHRAYANLPLRDRVPGQCVVDITGTPLAPHCLTLSGYLIEEAGQLRVVADADAGRRVLAAGRPTPLLEQPCAL